MYVDLFMTKIKNIIRASLIETSNADPSNGDPMICILDIFGFEFTPEKKLVSNVKDPSTGRQIEGMPLMRNSLEQFCINWCNETLQKLFISCTIKAENAFYKSELPFEIEMDISELDNGNTLEMIAGKKSISSYMSDVHSFKADKRNGQIVKTGEQKIIDRMKKEQGERLNYDCTVDNECPHGVKVGECGNKECIDAHRLVSYPTHLMSATKSEKIYKYLTDRKKLDNLSDEDQDHVFSLKHYAGHVVYSFFDWMTKDANRVSNDMMTMLKDCGIGEWVNEFYGKRMADGDKGNLITVEFKTNMEELEAVLAACNCWFTRCIKPCNKQASESVPPHNIAKLYEGYKVLDQLRYTGMLDSLTIRKIGYSARMAHEDFGLDFKCLSGTIKDPKQHDDLVKWILEQDWYEEGKSYFAKNGQGEDVLVGKTKILIRDTTYQMLMKKRTQFLAEEGKRIIAVFRAKRYKDDYMAQYNACVGGGEYRDDEASGDDPKVNKYKPAVEEGMNCMLRASISRMNYLKKKHNYLQMGARTPLVQLIRAQMARNVYQKARNAKFEATNRQLLASLMMATICRQWYYERKLEFAEEEMINAANERMETYEKSSTEFMLHLEDQERKAAEERITMKKEDEYAEAMKDSRFLEGLGKQKESIFMTASDNRRKAATAMQKLHEAAGDAAGLDEELAQNEEIIQLGAHRKVQEVLVATLPESLKECGTCALIRGPEVTDNQLVAEPLQPFPEKFDDLGTMRRY